MRTIHHYYRRFRLCFIEAAALSLFFCAFLLPSWKQYRHTGDNYFTITLNGVEIGHTGSADQIDKLMAKARKQVALEAVGSDLLLMDLNLETKGSEVVWAKIDSEETLISNMAEVMRKSVKETLHRSYTVKINETAVNLASHEEVHALLEQAIAAYDPQNTYDVELALDSNREVNVLEARITTKENAANEEQICYTAGITKALEEITDSIQPIMDKDFQEYEKGLVDIAYADKIEIGRAHV